MQQAKFISPSYSASEVQMVWGAPGRAWGAHLGGCFGVGWGNLSTSFSLVTSALFHIRATSASWVSAAFKIGVKESPSPWTCPFKQTRQYDGQQCLCTTLSVEKIHNQPGVLMLGWEEYLRVIYFSSPGWGSAWLAYPRFSSSECQPGHSVRCNWSVTRSHLFIL